MKKGKHGQNKGSRARVENLDGESGLMIRTLDGDPSADEEEPGEQVEQ